MSGASEFKAGGQARALCGTRATHLLLQPQLRFSIDSSSPNRSFLHHCTYFPKHKEPNSRSGLGDRVAAIINISTSVRPQTDVQRALPFPAQTKQPNCNTSQALFSEGPSSLLAQRLRTQLRFSLLPLRTYGWCQAQLLHPLRYPARETASSATEPGTQHRKIGTESHAQPPQLCMASHAPRQGSPTSLLVSFELNE